MTEQLRRVLADVEAEWVAMTSPAVVEQALHPPATEAEIDEAEQQLQHSIPSELRTFWRWHAGMRQPRLIPTYIWFYGPAFCAEWTLWWRRHMQDEGGIGFHADRMDLDWSQAVYIGDLGGGAYYFALPDGDHCRIMDVDHDGGSLEGPVSLLAGFTAFLHVLPREAVWHRDERGFWRHDHTKLTLTERRSSLHA